jgi:hypothetical protein
VNKSRLAQNEIENPGERLGDRTIDAERLERVAAAVERLEAAFEEFARTYLNSRFPYGKASDRWARRG